MGKVVIWGLKTDLNSYKFIHQSFLINFLKMGYEAIWVDDKKENTNCVSKFDIVFAVDVAAKHLPRVDGARYVLHNIAAESLNLEKNYLNIQVYTSSAVGENMGLPYVQWDKTKRILFQPWGVPTSPRDWKLPSIKKSTKEYWVGSVWNNELNQGNLEFMSGYVETLNGKGIKFLRKGATTRFQPNGISESQSMRLVNKSAIGAAVVGDWQKQNKYIPCRLFKNVASGAIPSSNADFSAIFGVDGGIFNSDPNILIEEVLQLNQSNKLDLVKGAQKAILPYTYRAGINRILTFLN